MTIWFNYSQAQKNTYIIIDQTNNKALPYATIKLPKYKNGLYSDFNGKFLLPKYVNGKDSINISYLGYYEKKLLVSKVKDSIFLNPKSENLEEVILRKEKSKRLVYGYRSNGSLTWSLDKDYELGTLIQPRKNCNNCMVDKLIIPIKKFTLKKINGEIIQIFPKFRTIMKLLIYSVKDGLPNEIILNKPIFIEVNQETSNELVISLSDEFIEYNKDGIFISLSKIESTSEEYNYLPLLLFTKKKSKTIIASSYFRTIFIDNNKWLPIKDRLSKIDLKKEYNLELKLEILEYK